MIHLVLGFAIGFAFFPYLITWSIMRKKKGVKLKVSKLSVFLGYVVTVIITAIIQSAIGTEGNQLLLLGLVVLTSIIVFSFVRNTAKDE